MISHRELLTVPSLFTGIRLVGVVPLLWLAWQGSRGHFLVLLVVLMLTDWIDGRLAVLLRQRSDWGARLDSAADAAVYGAVAIAFWWLEPDVVQAELAWMVAAVGTWALSATVCLVRFGQLPSYHTLAAKLGWLVAGVVTLYTIWSGVGTWVPWALALVVLTNLEAVAIGLVLHEWRADVPTLVHALRARRPGNDG